MLDEAFFDMPKFALHPQSLVMETLWVTHWIQRLLRKQAEIGTANGKDAIFVADRSPYSAVFYAKNNGSLLEPVIAAMQAELALHDIHIFTVYVQVGAAARIARQTVFLLLCAFCRVQIGFFLAFLSI